MDDVHTVRDWAVATLPQVDAKRVAIMGWSHGGYQTLMLLAKVRRYCRNRAGGEVRINAGVHWGDTVHLGAVITSARFEVTALGDDVGRAELPDGRRVAEPACRAGG